MGPGAWKVGRRGGFLQLASRFARGPWWLPCCPRRSPSRGRSTSCVRAWQPRGTGGKVYRLRRPAKVGSTRPRHRTVASWDQCFDTSPGAAVSRGSVARQCARSGAALDAEGGGRPNTSGTMDSGARNIVANSAGRSTLRCRAVRTTLARTCWVSAPLRVRLPARTPCG